MQSIKQLQKLRKLHQWIQNESSGSPHQIASRLHVSVRQVYLLLETLKDMGAPIAYSKATTTYFYRNSFDLEILISVKVIDHTNTTHIYAGAKTYINYLSNCKVTAVYKANLVLSKHYSDVDGLDVALF